MRNGRVTRLARLVFAALVLGATILTSASIAGATTPPPAGKDLVDIPVGPAPYAVAVDPITQMAYVAINASPGGQVDVISEVTNAMVATISVGNTPQGIALDPNTHLVYVSNVNGSSVSVIDGSASPPALKATIPVSANPYGVAVDPASGLVYVTHYRNGDPDSTHTYTTVSVISEASNAVTAVTVGNSPIAAAVDTVHHTVYVANQGDGTVSVIDGKTNAVISTIGSAPSSLDDLGIGTGSQPNSVAWNPNNGSMYVSLNYAGEVVVISEATNTVTSHIRLAATGPSGSRPTGVAVDALTNLVYVSDCQCSVTPYPVGKGEVIDAGTNTLLASTLQLAGPFSCSGGGPTPSSLAVDSGLNVVYIASLCGAGGYVSAFQGYLGIAPPNKDSCKDGDYQYFIDPRTGLAFTNQGECVSYVVHNISHQ